MPDRLIRWVNSALPYIDHLTRLVLRRLRSPGDYYQVDSKPLQFHSAWEGNDHCDRQPFW